MYRPVASPTVPDATSPTHMLLAIIADATDACNAIFGMHMVQLCHTLSRYVYYSIINVTVSKYLFRALEPYDSIRKMALGQRVKRFEPDQPPRAKDCFMRGELYINIGTGPDGPTMKLLKVSKFSQFYLSGFYRKYSINLTLYVRKCPSSQYLPGNSAPAAKCDIWAPGGRKYLPAMLKTLELFVCGVSI